MRRLLSTLGLVVVLAALGGYIYFVDNKKPPAGDTTKSKAFDIKADDIQELQITVPEGDTTRAQRTSDGWKLVAPTEAEGDSSELTNMASSLASLDIQRVVDEQPAKLDDYGLNPPHVEVSYKTKGNQQGQILIGDKTPTGGDVYAMKPGEKRVFLVSAFIEDTFKRSAFDLRDKRVLKFDRDKVTGVEITRDGMVMQFARKGADWTIEKPSPMRADFAALEGLITSLQATLMHKFVSNDATPAELRSYGLDKPSASASILMGTDKATLLLGRTENAETYAKDASRPMVVMVAPTVVADLAKPLSEYRRKELFDLRSYSANHLELTRGTQVLTLDRMEQGDKSVWKANGGSEIASDKVEDLLTKLSNMRAKSFEDKADPALKSPALVVKANFGASKGEHRMETVTLARSGDTIIASRPDEPGAMAIEGTSLDDVLKAIDGLK